MRTASRVNVLVVGLALALGLMASAPKALSQG